MSAQGHCVFTTNNLPPHPLRKFLKESDQSFEKSYAFSLRGGLDFVPSKCPPCRIFFLRTKNDVRRIQNNLPPPIDGSGSIELQVFWPSTQLQVTCSVGGPGVSNHNPRANIFMAPHGKPSFKSCVKIKETPPHLLIESHRLCLSGQVPTALALRAF